MATFNETKYLPLLEFLGVDDLHVGIAIRESGGSLWVIVRELLDHPDNPSKTLTIHRWHDDVAPALWVPELTIDIRQDDLDEDAWDDLGGRWLAFAHAVTAQPERWLELRARHGLDGYDG
jgi:hypothetical protein